LGKDTESGDPEKGFDPYVAAHLIIGGRWGLGKSENGVSGTKDGVEDADGRDF